MPIDQPQNDPATWCGIILAGGAASRLGGVNKALGIIRLSETQGLLDTPMRRQVAVEASYQMKLKFVPV